MHIEIVEEINTRQKLSFRLMIRKLASNYSLLLLVGFNLYFIWYYNQHPDGFKTLLFIYWFQSVMIGFFTFLQLLTTPAEQTTGLITDQNTGKPLAKGCSALFFAVHYGIFHLVYLVFLAVREGGRIDFLLLKISFFIILVAELMEFIRKRRAISVNKVNQGFAFFLPYLRIIPMHIMIVGAAFLNLSDVTIFLVLKTLADVGMYVLTNSLYFHSSTE
jgi:hypothetical protein